MHTTLDLLNEISLRLGKCSDYRIAKVLEVPQTSVSNWRTGRRVMSPDFGPSVARLLDWDPAYVMACLEHERADKAGEDVDPAVLSTWQRIAEKFRPHLPVILAALLLPLGGVIPERAQALSVILRSQQIQPIYTLCEVSWRLGRSRKRARPNPLQRITRWFRTEFPADFALPA